MTQKETLIKLLRDNKKVTLRMLFENGIGYTARNRVSELRAEGFVIEHTAGNTVSDNSYTLVAEPGEPAAPPAENPFGFFEGQGYIKGLLA